MGDLEEATGAAAEQTEAESHKTRSQDFSEVTGWWWGVTRLSFFLALLTLGSWVGWGWEHGDRRTGETMEEPVTEAQVTGDGHMGHWLP